VIDALTGVAWYVVGAILGLLIAACFRGPRGGKRSRV
jgi:hypothetical protein